MTNDASEQGQVDPKPEGQSGSTEGTSSTGSYAWPSGKAELSKRIVAVVIDAVISVLVGLIPWIGGIISAAYWVLRDGMELEFMDNRSVGKKLVKLRPISADGQKLDMTMSIQRNWMFGLGGLMWFLAYIPIIGWLLMVPVGLIALGFGLVELIKVLTDEEGRRFGDVWANTKVIEVQD
jgi:hypothetical protein